MSVNNDQPPEAIAHSAPDEDANTEIIQRYGVERAKRLREDGMRQYIDIALSPQHQRFGADPWVDPTKVQDLDAMFPNGQIEVLVIGGGWGGILSAAHMVEVGIEPEDIRIVDSAGHFGGTWYWNRYPGLTCDIESYSYLPLLEELGYMPKHRYSSGEEIRAYVNRVVKECGLADCGVFQTKVQRMVWDEDWGEWHVHLQQNRDGENEPKSLTIRAQVVSLASGILSQPHLPKIPGILDYEGAMFHSSRWSYNITGGSPSDPSLAKLRDKRVAVIGTGATSVQVVPQIARWSKHLYVVQRTPASVDERGQRETDKDWFREMARSKGWQRERIKNFHQSMSLSNRPAVNLVDDAWTRAYGMVAVSGNIDGPRSLEEIPPYVEKLHAIDLERQNRIRARVDDHVRDPVTAAKLKPWYPTWCKRPLFHDEYLKTFNNSNVTLLDTDGKGIDSITADSIVIGDEAYPVDVIIFATGFRSPAAGTPADRANMTIIGRNGISMREAWGNTGPQTLHGVIDSRFPNLFLSGPSQVSIGVNYRFSVEQIAKHAAYILAEARDRANGRPFAIGTTEEAAENWGNQIMSRAGAFGAVYGCTPGYFNLEGEIERIPPEIQPQFARSGLLGSGIEHYVSILEAWRDEGSMEGIEVRVQGETGLEGRHFCLFSKVTY